MPTYIKNKNWNKSKTLLYPLLFGYKRYSNVVKPLQSVTLFIDSNGNTYSIADGYFTCIYNSETYVLDIEDVDIVYTKKLLNKQLLVVYNLSKYLDICNRFICGEYSLIDEKIKKRILNFYNIRKTEEVSQPDETGILIDLILYPEKYYEIVSEELNIDINILKEARELASKPDFNTEETLQL